MKRFIAGLLLVAFLFTTACSTDKNTSGDIVKPEQEGSKPEITILANIEELGALKASKALEEYMEKFQQRYGVKIKLQGIGNNSSFYFIGSQILTNEAIDEFKKELSAKLYQKEGPELIYSRDTPLDALVKEEAAVDMKDKIENLGKLYPGLVGDKVYYVPFNLNYLPVILNKSALQELNIAEPDLSWTKEAYFNMKHQWLQQTQREFTSKDFLEILQEYLFPIEIFEEGKSKVSINNPQMIAALGDIRQAIFDGSFKLPSGYVEQNYYNLLFDRQSEEYIKDRDLCVSKEKLLDSLRDTRLEYRTNALHPLDTSSSFADGELLIRPYVLEEKQYVSSEGFFVNKNGKNLELAYEFINGLLEDEVQLAIYNEQPFPNYPASKAVEAEIIQIEKGKNYAPGAIVLRKYLLQQIEQGSAVLDAYRDQRVEKIRWMLVKDLTKILFAEKAYSSAELSTELQKLENKYNIFLSE